MKEIILQKRDYNICWIFNIGVEKYWQKDNFEIKNIEVCQWLLNGMIVAALLNLCGKIQTKCKLEKIW